MRKFALLILACGCGAEFMPSSRSYEPRTAWEEVLVLEQPDRSHFQTIGTVIARARRSTHAIDACRKEAANHGGDAITATLVRGGEWRCSVLRRSEVAMTPTEPPPDPTKIVKHARSTAEAAKQFSDVGKEAFDASDFERSVRNFYYSYVMSPSPTVLYNIGATLERLKRYHDAAVMFTRYSLTLEPSEDPKQNVHQKNVRDRIEKNRQRAGDAVPIVPLDEAKRANAAAKYAFEHKDYETAIAQFLRGYVLAPNAPLVFNLGVALESTGHFQIAAAIFDRYLESAGPPTDDSEQQLRTRTRARADADRDRPEPRAPSAGQL
jgi:tetratricopeptide (TPR) repeat protein